MRLRSAVCVAALALVAIVPAAGQASFPFEDVDFTPDCAPNAAFDHLLSLFVPRYDDDGSASEAPVYEIVSGDVSQVLRLDAAADWHGLELIEVRFHHGLERGPANFTLAFADEPERVRAVWNERGWNLPPIGEAREVEGLEGYAFVGVEVDGDLSTVTCYRD